MDDSRGCGVGVLASRFPFRLRDWLGELNDGEFAELRNALIR